MNYEGLVGAALFIIGLVVGLAGVQVRVFVGNNFRDRSHSHRIGHS